MDDEMEFEIELSTDEDGFVGRECPEPDCEGYFKIIPGTGLKGEDLPCSCPYCGISKPMDHFWTKDQVEYAKSFAMREVSNMIHKELKKSEFEIKPKGGFGIGLSLKVQQKGSFPIRYYQEKELETTVICDNCSCHYAVYGVYVLCPDCGKRNSFGILRMNHEIIKKTLDLSKEAEKEVAEHLIWNALEDCVSTFDGYGREFCRTFAYKSNNEEKAKNIRFQDLEKANQRVKSFFGLDMSTSVSREDWQFVLTGFQKRHLISHNSGVIDEQYISKTGDSEAVLGRKILVTREEVADLSRIVEELGSYLAEYI